MTSSDRPRDQADMHTVVLAAAGHRNPVPDAWAAVRQGAVTRLAHIVESNATVSASCGRQCESDSEVLGLVRGCADFVGTLAAGGADGGTRAVRIQRRGVEAGDRRGAGVLDISVHLLTSMP